ncbi:hypothetical protein [Cellulomonas sp. KRMCY2]|uniref:hypothetical protein n=1 Tax=Cellulomonas sp. KRMCY2 TaxID=1304865 RepID=UPI00045E70AE|nr:hypothetical protein [Cellulomonas sp. KRMCY2]
MSEAPHPRVLFEDVPDDVFSELAPLVGTAIQIGNDDPIHASDWDLLVTFSWDAGSREGALHILSFGAEHLDLVYKGSHGSALRKANTTHARGGDVAHGVAPDLAGLVRRTVVERISPDERTTWMVSWGDPFSGPDDIDMTDDLDGACEPLVHVGEERFVYALHRPRDPRREHPTLCWALPAETAGHREWLLYVLDQLRVYDPDKFPSDPSWQTRETWAPPPLGVVMRRRADLEVDWAAAQTVFEEKRRELAEEVESQVRVAAAGVWRLLTAQGDDLIAAVTDALRDLGFDVRDMDGHHDAKTGAKLEDLRVSDSDDHAWECLVEVKGYTKGAKVNDVQQITGRPSVHYAAEEGRPPSSVWHVVNSFLGTDPSSRPPAIPSDLDLNPLTTADGALIDTRDLYLAWRDVATGTVTAAEVRESLRQAVTRWRRPVAGSDANPAAPAGDEDAGTDA